MVRQGAGIPVAVAIRPLAPVTGGGFLHARSIYDNAQEPHPHEERTVTGASWLVAWFILLLALIVIAVTIIPPRGD